MADEVAAALAAWLTGHGDPAAVAVTGRATGGLSQETWFVQLNRGGALEPAVLRLPTAASGGRAIAAQVAALQAVADSSVPAPTLLHVAAADDGIDGRPFLLMSRARGTVPVGWHVVPGPVRTRLASRAIDVLADLHAIELDGTSFAEQRPHPLMELVGLSRAAERVGPVPRALAAALRWLDRHRPAPDGAPVLVHGDYRMGNLVVDGDDLVAVLDWELTAPGDRLVDLAWCFLPVFEDPGVDEGPMVQRYEARAGVAVDRQALAWHRVQALARLAYYSLAGTRAFDTGSSDDLRLAALRLRLPATLARLGRAMDRHAGGNPAG